MTERINAAVEREEPSWRAVVRLAGSGSSPAPSASGTWEADGCHINVWLSVHPSEREAQRFVEREGMMAPRMESSGLTSIVWNVSRKANVAVLIRVGPKPDRRPPAETGGGISPGITASIAGRLAEIIREQIGGEVRTGACVNEFFPLRRPPPSSAHEAFQQDVEAGCLSRVEQALAAGMDANSRDESGTPVMWRAVSGGRREIVQILLRYGADPVARAGRSSLKPAMLGVLSRYEAYYPEDLPRILANQLGIVDDLVSAGASIDVRDWYTGRTLLLEVAGMSHDDGSPAVLLKGLIERGADVQARDSEGRTALMIAVSHTNSSVTAERLKEFLAAGACVNARDASGKSALDYAREQIARYPHDRLEGIVGVLFEAGATE